jgi:hypothetical protein
VAIVSQVSAQERAPLRAVLWVDGAAGIASVAAQLLAPAVFSSMYGLPVPLVQGSALVLLVYVGLIATLLFKPAQSNFRLGVLVGANLAWVAASMWVAFEAQLDLPALGRAYVVGQAVFVAALAALEYAFRPQSRGAFAAEYGATEQ